MIQPFLDNGRSLSLQIALDRILVIIPVGEIFMSFFFCEKQFINFLLHLCGLDHLNVEFIMHQKYKHISKSRENRPETLD